MIIVHVRKNENSRVTRNSYTGQGHRSLAAANAQAWRAHGYQAAATVEDAGTPADEWAEPLPSDWN